jgi:hypothetical protein
MSTDVTSVALDVKHSITVDFRLVNQTMKSIGPELQSNPDVARPIVRVLQLIGIQAADAAVDVKGAVQDP